MFSPASRWLLRASVLGFHGFGVRGFAGVLASASVLKGSGVVIDEHPNWGLGSLHKCKQPAMSSVAVMKSIRWSPVPSHITRALHLRYLPYRNIHITCTWKALQGNLDI